MNLLCACALLLPLGLCAGEPLRTWDYATLDDVVLSVAGQGNRAAMQASPTVRAPGGAVALEVALAELNQDSPAWDIQLRFVHAGGLKAGRYVIEIPCKASIAGTALLAGASADAPWTILPGAESAIELRPEWRTLRWRLNLAQGHGGRLALPRMMLADFGAPAILHFGPLVLRELPPALSPALGGEWDVFADLPDPKDPGVMPATGSGLRMALTGGDHISLSALPGGPREHRAAWLFNRFECTMSGTMRVGFSADWWMTIYLNGAKIFDNTASGGNLSHAFVPDDNPVDLPVRSGTNLLAVKVLSGSNGWHFVCGPTVREPGELFTVLPGADWKPIDMTRLRVTPGSALDFSALAGERRPAGSRGRLLVGPTGHFAFAQDPATPVRLFGFNTWQMNKVEGWSREQIKDFATAMARQGYNAIRIQAIDFILTGGDRRWGWKDRLKPLAEALALPPAFDPQAMDQFDYVLSCLRDNGIHYNLDLMNISGYCLDEYQKRPAGQGFGNQILLRSRPHMRHWEMAVRQLFDHRNPYTGLRLADDPALICVEPLNEQDILLFNAPLMKGLSQLFREHLRTVYADEAALRTAWGRPEATFDGVPDIDEAMLRGGDARSADVARYLVGNMTALTDWYAERIRAAGYPGLISQWDMIMRTLEQPVRARMPVIAQHSYFAHPKGVATRNLVAKSPVNGLFSWGAGSSDIVVDQGSSLGGSYMRAAATVRHLDRPFMLTEYSHSSFNRYRHERGLYLGAYAALQGWDALHCHGMMVMNPRQEGKPFMDFDNPQDPVSRASEVVTALAWLRRDVQEAPHAVQLTLSTARLFPKHVLAAVGDDYSKLAMLTRIGLAYPEIRPLMPVGTARPDLELVPEEFSPLNISQWYATASSKDGSAFPGLVEKLKAARILPADNRTDYARRLYHSETGEILLDGRTETMSVVTPRLEGAVMKKDDPVRLGAVWVAACSRPAAVAVAAIDGARPIAEAKRLLLVLSTNALNTGMTFENESMYLMAEVGRPPVLMQTARLVLEVKTAHAGRPALYALALDGSRAEELPVAMRDGRVRVTIDTAALKYGTPFFELVWP